MTILELLTRAKETYIRGNVEGHPMNSGMCYSIKLEYYLETHFLLEYEELNVLIPEFTPEFFGLTVDRWKYWWDPELTQPRIKVFDTLIEIYKDNKDEIDYKGGWDGRREG